MDFIPQKITNGYDCDHDYVHDRVHDHDDDDHYIYVRQNVNGYDWYCFKYLTYLVLLVPCYFIYCYFD